jgi:predicted O-methyltransferase YrrM
MSKTKSDINTDILITRENYKEIRGRAHSDPSNIDFFNRLKEVSMLGTDALVMTSEAARHSRGAILEIGAYIGGSSIALAHGAKQRAGNAPFKMFTIEPGGAYPDQPYLPSSDILADWETNLSRYGLRDAVDLVVGYSNANEVVETVKGALGDKRFGLVFVDGNGELERDINLYLDVLADDCILVLDDYRYDDGLKGGVLTQFIDRMVAEGLFEEFGFELWNTWFGRLTPAYRAAAGR